MANKRGNQRQRIIQFMKSNNGSITRLDSSTKLLIFELSSRIIELQNRGWVFDKTWETSKNIYGETKSYVRYTIIKEGTEI